MEEKIIKNAVLMLAKAHKTKDSTLLNYASDILDSNKHLNGFDDLLKFYGDCYL